MNRSSSCVGRETDAIARIDSDPGEFDAPTRIGPMSAVAVAKLMHDAELETAKSPLSGIRRSSPGETDDIPALGADEDSLEPTVVNPVAARSGFEAGKEAVRRQTSRSLVDAIADEMVTLNDADLEPDVPSKPPPLPHRASSSVGPARWQPRPAAFPDWIPRAQHALPNDRNGKRSIWIAAAGGGLATFIMLVWWLCSAQ